MFDTGLIERRQCKVTGNEKQNRHHKNVTKEKKDVYYATWFVIVKRLRYNLPQSERLKQTLPLVSAGYRKTADGVRLSGHV
jgi:hypothetical protein